MLNYSINANTDTYLCIFDIFKVFFDPSKNIQSMYGKYKRHKYLFKDLSKII